MHSIVAICAGGMAVFLATAPGLAQDCSEPHIENGRAVAVGAYAREPGDACFHCHGIDKAGDSTAGFPRLTDQTFNYLYESLQGYASGDRPRAAGLAGAAAAVPQSLTVAEAQTPTAPIQPAPADQGTEPRVEGGEPE